MEEQRETTWLSCINGYIETGQESTPLRSLNVERELASRSTFRDLRGKLFLHELRP